MSASAPGAVFLSYASQDATAARRICDALRAAGLEVWFDQNELVGGDAWDQKIRTQIGTCALFVPLISANTNARGEGYFRLEWKLAVDRSHLMAHDQPFLLPVVIDATADATARVPPEFRAVQWTRLPAGETSPAFVAHIQHLLGATTVGRASRPDDSSPPTESGPKAPPTKAHPRRPSAAVWSLTAITALALAGYFLFVRPAPKPANNTASAPATASVTPPPASEKSAPTVADKSLVVLPLENHSPDPENAFFTNGMHSEITTTLSRIPDLKVISRESAAALKTIPGSLAEKARRVGVANVMTGSVRREGTRVLVALELRRAHDESLLWSQRYDKQLGAGTLAIQTEVAEQVARTLQARESKGAYAGAQFMTANPEAYDLFLKASQTHYADRTREGRQKVIAALEQVLSLDPKFSSAARLLSVAHSRQYAINADPQRSLRNAQEAKRWAETARRLQPDGTCDDALAAYYNAVEPDNARALMLGESAAKALPNDAAVQNILGGVLAQAGRSSEAVSAYQRAVALDPLNGIFRGNLFGELARLRRARDFAEAEAGYVAIAGVEAKERVPLSSRFTLNGNIPDGRGGRSLYALQMRRRDAEVLVVIEADLAETELGRHSRWRRWIQKCDILRRLGREADSALAAQEAKKLMDALNAEPAFDPSERDGRLAVTLARLGQADEAIAAGRRYVAARSPTNQVRSRWDREIALAELHAYLNRPRECVDLLAKLLRVPSGLTVPMLKADPAWDPVRDDPAFQALLADPKNSAPL
jgi:TolB-like protein/Flp pilus assembly protein TadD